MFIYIKCCAVLRVGNASLLLISLWSAAKTGRERHFYRCVLIFLITLLNGTHLNKQWNSITLMATRVRFKTLCIRSKIHWHTYLFIKIYSLYDLGILKWVCILCVCTSTKVLKTFNCFFMQAKFQWTWKRLWLSCSLEDSSDFWHHLGFVTEFNAPTVRLYRRFS